MAKLKPNPAVVSLWFVVGALVVLLGVAVFRKVEAPDNKRAARAEQQEHRMERNQKGNETPEPPKKEEPPLIPTYRFVALYGTPGSTVMGALGEQPLDAAVARAKGIAAEYQPLTTEKVRPTFEIIATVASSSPTPNGDYSNERDISELKPWVDAAKQQGIYVLLDLQPGRGDFLTQAKLYEPLLKEPHVGLALDPEWRLKPNQVHLEQIGSVSAVEVNSVADWLATLTKQNKLPQKLFLLHQFRLSMITDRSTLNTSHKELAYVIQMDGHGAQSTKMDTWQTVRQDAPANTNFGWKNFYRQDKPMLTPQQTMLLDPKPWYVSYQ